MNALQKPEKMTADKFFSWVHEQEQGRYELISAQIIAMAPEVSDHARAKRNVFVSLRTVTKKRRLPCEAFVNRLGVRIDAETVCEPDRLVNCGERVAPDSLHAPNPVIVVEVISSSSRRKDTGAKLADYFRLPSVAHYLVSDLQRRQIMHHARADAGRILTSIVNSGSIAPEPPDVSISVEDIFLGTT
jgi:Uma2 family endonuclease